jgi:hypothetical protein
LATSPSSANSLFPSGEAAAYSTDALASINAHPMAILRRAIMIPPLILRPSLGDREANR